MKNIGKLFFITPCVVRFVVALFAVATVVGCSSGNIDGLDEASGSLNPAEELGNLTGTEKILYSENYAGYLVVYLNEALGARLDSSNRFYSTTGNDAALGTMEELLSRYPDAVIKRSVETDPERLDARRAELQALSGKKLADFNSIYHVHITKSDEAVKLMRELEVLPSVERVYPKLKLEVASLINTPSLVTHQGYLYPESTHGGLNAMAAWNAGVRGEDVILVDGDVAWNLDHEDIDYPADFGLNSLACGAGSTSESCPRYIAHGTAMAGIMAAIDNDHGITGMAPNVELHGATLASYGLGKYLVDLTDRADENGELIPGSIFTIMLDMSGPNTPGQNCFVTPFGCLPAEVDPENFDGIGYAVSAGVTVILVAGNGEQDLDDPSSYWSWGKNLSQNDSGSILVGASNGAAKQKAWFTNYGTPVDVFAWGENVVSTSDPIPAEPDWDWLGTTPPVPPDPMDTNAFFVDVVVGTSPATAQIGAVAALIQSYAKQVMGTTRYIMPLKMREILVQSGVSQSGGGGAIGKQPRIDVAMNLVDTAWNAWRTQYPELELNQQLPQDDVSTLRSSGLGLICDVNDLPNSDPSCPDDSMWVPGSGIAETMDFDGDGRADLVSWSRGQFKIDLSGVGNGAADGFGAWDVYINYPQIPSDVVWPYVEDMNSDGRTDLVLYDKANGEWYIAYTTSWLLSGGGFGGWDHVITADVHDELAMDPWQSQYCRPHPGDYDGDGWVDLAVACSDGVWYIAHSPGVNWADDINYDQQVNYLTSQQLAAAPGWAYLTGGYNIHGDGDERTDLFIKVPDGVIDEGRLIIFPSPTFGADFFSSVPHIYGGNNIVLSVGNLTYPAPSVGLKTAGGDWFVTDPDDYDILNVPFPDNVYGGIDCHPIVSDFDGDGKDDRTVMCPGEWRIAYSGNIYANLKSGGGYRPVPLGYDIATFTLPGRSYSGGISYALVQDLIQFFLELNPTEPPSIPVDMVSVATCEFVGGGECQ